MANAPPPSAAGRTRWPLLALCGLLATGAARADLPRPRQGPPGEREAVVLNRSPKPMNEIYASPQTADQWGEDRLGDRTLAPGGTLRLRLDGGRACIYDFKVIYEDGSREEHRGRDVCRDRQVAFDGSTATPPPDAGKAHSLVVVDNSPRPIQQLYISPPQSTQWGDDLLANGSISVGERRQLTWHGDCHADLRVVFENRAAEERRGLDLCQTPAISIQPGWTTSDELPTPEAK